MTYFSHKPVGPAPQKASEVRDYIRDYSILTWNQSVESTQWMEDNNTSTNTNTTFAQVTESSPN